MNEIFADVAVIGGGAAGLICAGTAAKRGLNVIIIEKNQKCARKVMITGKGRCNLTNKSDLQQLITSVPKNGRFLYSAFSEFTPDDIIDLVESFGVKTKVERGKRVFPVSDKAVDIVDALVSYAMSNGATIINSPAKDIITTNNTLSEIHLENGDVVKAENTIIATGGMSYPGTGSTGDGYEFARKIGHTVNELTPSLVPLNTREGYAAAMQGLSLKNVRVTAVDNRKNGRVIYEDFGELMFTHFGLTGPTILSMSAHLRNMTDSRYSVHIDLKPALDEKTLDARLIRDFMQNSNKIFQNSLSELLPSKMIPVIVRLSEIPATLKVNQITKEQRAKLLKLIKCLPFTITGFRPISEAIVTSGGVNVKEVDPKTMRSKICENVYFAGEILDVDAYTGGFNLQIAFSTGFVAGKSVCIGKGNYD